MYLFFLFMFCLNSMEFEKEQIIIRITHWFLYGLCTIGRNYKRTGSSKVKTSLKLCCYGVLWNSCMPFIWITSQMSTHVEKRNAIPVLPCRTKEIPFQLWTFMRCMVVPFALTYLQKKSFFPSFIQFLVCVLSFRKSQSISTMQWFRHEQPFVRVQQVLF